MAGLGPIVQEFHVVPDVSKLHAMMAVLEKHLGALRADLEQFLDPEASPEPAPEVPAES